jgi:hypothetical protein
MLRACGFCLGVGARGIYRVVDATMCNSVVMAAFTSVVHEPASSRLVIWLAENEDSFKPTRAIEFKDIKQFEIRCTDGKDRWVEGFLGAHESNSPA